MVVLVNDTIEMVVPVNEMIKMVHLLDVTIKMVVPVNETMEIVLPVYKMIEIVLLNEMMNYEECKRNVIMIMLGMMAVKLLQLTVLD